MIEPLLEKYMPTISSELRYTRSEHKFFEAFYWPPNINVDHPLFYIRVGTVDYKKGEEAKVYMESIVLPKFVQWADKVASALPAENSCFYMSKPK